jgi:hypothetical protein
MRNAQLVLSIAVEQVGTQRKHILLYVAYVCLLQFFVEIITVFWEPLGCCYCENRNFIAYKYEFFKS